MILDLVGRSNTSTMCRTVGRCPVPGATKLRMMVSDLDRVYLLAKLTRTIVAEPFPITPVPLLIGRFLILVSLLDISRRTLHVRDAGLCYVLSTNVAHRNNILIEGVGGYSPPIHGEQNSCLRNPPCHREYPGFISERKMTRS
jgi:hypothetical protein